MTGFSGPMFIKTGTYTPVLYPIANIGAPSLFLLANPNYARMGDMVLVAGAFQLAATAAGAVTLFEMDLPIPSAITNAFQVIGTAASFNSVAATALSVYGDTGAKRAIFQFSAPDTSGNSYTFLFWYRLL